MDDALGNHFWASKPLYLGKETRPGVDIDAEEYMHRVETMIFPGAPEATGPQKIIAFTAGFRAEARTWWVKDMPFLTTKVLMAQYNADWNLFRARFVKEYYPFNKKADAAINFAAWKQGPKESLESFLKRINSGAREFAALIAPKADDAVPATWTVPTREGTAAQIAARTALIAEYAAFNGARTADFCSFMKDSEVAHRDKFIESYTACLAIKVALNGMRDKRLRPVLLKGMEEDDALQTLLDKIKTAENNLSKLPPPTGGQPSTNGNGNNNKKKNKANHGAASVTPNDEEHDEEEDPDAQHEDDEGVDKVNATRGGSSGRGGKGRGGRGRGNNSGGRGQLDLTKKCTFCHRPGHLVSDCKTIKSCANEQKEKRSTEASQRAPFGAQAQADGQIPLFNTGASGPNMAGMDATDMPLPGFQGLKF